MDKLPIGRLVQTNLPQIFEYCTKVDPDEFINLFDPAFCKKEFELHQPFLQTPAEIAVGDKQTKYWVKVHLVLGHEVRITNDWFERSRAPFLLYLLDHGLIPVGISPETVNQIVTDHASAEAPVVKAGAKGKTKKPAHGSRYRIHAVGNAQNFAVRNVLGRIGIESFTEKDWLTSKADFGFACAYCGSPRQLIMDHAVPISIEALGEHRLGNLVPACPTCNSEKSSESFDTYLRKVRETHEATARIATIRTHMASHGYQPLTELLSPADADIAREKLRTMREAIAMLATATAASINDLLP